VTAIGIMGGTFDPIHYGHLRAAEEVLQGFELERIVFVPSGRPPHKSTSEITSFEHRYQMTILATQNHPRFEVSRMEIERPGPSFTVNSLREFRKVYGKSANLYFITGLDAILEISTWSGYKEIFDYADFIAVKVHPFPVTLLAIASRDIRKSVVEGKSPRYLVPDPVLEYIVTNRLYSF
jgi:nicotinate-nucleotide adenylyltransferase